MECDDGYHLDLVSEELHTPVCTCKPSCKTVPGLKHKMTATHSAWFGSGSPEPIEGQCTFIPPTEPHTIVTAKDVSG